jgi:hypothetical protein
MVVERDDSGGLSALREDRPGAFGPWRGLGGRDVQGSPSAALGPGGRLVVVAATSRDVVRWDQTAPGQLPAGPRPLLTVSPAGPPVVERAPGGNLRLLVEPSGGETVDAHTCGPGGRVSAPQHLPGPGGMDQPALSGGVAFVRDGSGIVRAAVPGGAWVDLGGPVQEAPVAITEPGGGTTLLAAAPDGQLLHDEREPGPGLGFRGWQPVEHRGASAEAAEPH